VCIKRIKLSGRKHQTNLFGKKTVEKGWGNRWEKGDEKGEPSPKAVGT